MEQSTVSNILDDLKVHLIEYMVAIGTKEVHMGVGNGSVGSHLLKTLTKLKITFFTFNRYIKQFSTLF